MRKAIKADLAHVLEEGISSSSSWPPCNPNVSVYIVDVMVLLHKTPAQYYCESFGDMVEALLAHVMRHFKHVNTIICVFDQYGDSTDVKAYERKRRATTTPKKYDVLASAPLPKWTKFLEVDDNKTTFSLFMSHHFEKHAPSDMKEDQRLILTGGYTESRMTKMITRANITDMPDMQTTQLESDCRMFYMAYHMDTEFASHDSQGSIILYSTDTDVLVLACHHTPYLKHSLVYWETGTTTKYENTHRFVPVHDIVEHRGVSLMSILPHLHALSGCDSTSALFYVGKKSVMKVVSNHDIEQFMALTSLAEENTNSAVDADRMLVSLLYDTAEKHKTLHGDLNRLRTKLASTKETAMSRLPPCEPVFLQHVLRTMWQVRLWVNARTPELVHGSPFACGWQTTADEIEPVMYEGTTAAEMVDGLACDCKGKNRCKNECPCFVTGLACIELCVCESEESKCHNPKTFIFDSA